MPRANKSKAAARIPINRISAGSRNRKIALIAVSAVLVAAIAVAGFILTGNRRYDHQLEIADKAFAEGNYELAEAEQMHLELLAMNFSMTDIVIAQEDIRKKLV